MSDYFTNGLDVNIIQSDDYLSELLELTIDGNILLVTSQGFSRRGVVANIIHIFGKERVMVFDQVTPNPEKSFIQTQYQQFAGKGIENVIAIGGGSVIDTAKIFSALLSYPNQSLEQLLNRNDLTCGINLIGIPTTSGTGAEVTPFATVWDSDTNSKYSLYGIKPRHAVLDSKLTLTLPYSETLYPALDALSHALESLWNKNRTQASQEFATTAIELICEALPKVLKEPDDIQSRKQLQSAATLAGLAISTTKTALAHAISYPLTLQYGVPHGLACSFSLLAIVELIADNVLNFSKNLDAKIKILLTEIDFDKELSTFASWQDIQSLSKLNFDQSRTGNFITSVDRLLVTKVLQRSQQLAKAVG